MNLFFYKIKTARQKQTFQVLLFFPKLYIIVLHPEKNVRASYTTTKLIRFDLIRYNSFIFKVISYLIFGRYLFIGSLFEI